MIFLRCCSEDWLFRTSKCCLCLLRECTNVLEAVSQGATSAVGLVASIVVNLIAFLALLAFFDAVLSWLGGMLDCPQLSFSVMATTWHPNTFRHILTVNIFKHWPICTHSSVSSMCLSFSLSSLTCSCLSPSWWVFPGRTVSLWLSWLVWRHFSMSLWPIRSCQN